MGSYMWINGRWYRYGEQVIPSLVRMERVRTRLIHVGWSSSLAGPL